eukprot:2750890-Pyramimonas_sp.AAC.1
MDGYILTMDQSDAGTHLRVVHRVQRGEGDVYENLLRVVVVVQRQPVKERRPVVDDVRNGVHPRDGRRVQHLRADAVADMSYHATVAHHTTHGSTPRGVHPCTNRSRRGGSIYSA